ncbi:hypothetical protein IEQ34_004145 [Dendrobium chrysotoxum]|uniref:HTH OST-type domain-containing protein n=1 Tax=Dendrobium chrysotoxum TaxID=161865 RepID=A0AAV7HGB2_DENCH|nr:hypothetical protein IEQ34_004145 [Dendrobium chrysotoxum]
MTGRSPSPKIQIPEIASPSGAMSVTSTNEPTHSSVLRSENLHGPVAILWDIENCPVPNDVRPEDVAGNIRLALRVHPLIKGAVTMFAAYGDFNSFPRRLREGCQRTGVKLVDVPNGRKDAADKAILVDMFLFALDNRPPSSILLISGDVDFAPALHILGQRGYTVILVIPSKVGVSSALCNAGRFVWDWPSIARGEGFVPSRTSVAQGSERSVYLMNNYFDNCPDIQIEEEAIVYKRKWLQFMQSPSRMSEVPSRDQSCRAQDSWVQPGDIQGLKGQLVKLLEISGGSLPLVSDRHIKKYENIPIILKRNKNDKGIVGETVDNGISPNTGSSTDDSSDDERNADAGCEFDELLEGFTREIQEILVCYSCPVPLDCFEALYEQRYKKIVDYQKFGAEGLEDLVEKVRDVVELCEDEGSEKNSSSPAL